jgi:predicted transcriptional regulator
MRLMRTSLLCSCLSLGLLGGGRALAADLKPQAPLAAAVKLPDTELEGTGGGTHRLADYLGRVLVVFYEDRNSSRQNAKLKEDMRERAQHTDLAKKVTFLPIADLDGYGFFAVKPFARSAVRSMAEKFGIEILMDWSGDLVQALGLAPEKSNVLILDRAGRVVYRATGALGPEDRDRFFHALDSAAAS